LSKINVLIGSIQPKRMNTSDDSFVWLPHSSGCLISYANRTEKIRDEIHFMTPIFRSVDFYHYDDDLKKADILCLTNYVWNQKYNDNFVKHYKKVNPAGKVVYGGANVPEHPELAQEYAEQRPEVDLFFVGPGEKNFTDFLCDLKSLNDKTVNGAFGRGWSNVTVNKDLYAIGKDELPQPYAEGIFDSIIERMKPKTVAISFETTRGCPYKCAFCDWGGLSRSIVTKFDIDDVKDTIEWIYQNSDKVVVVDFIDANLGMAARDVEILKYFKECSERYNGHVFISLNGYVKNGSPYLKETIERVSDLNEAARVAMNTGSGVASNIAQKGVNKSVTMSFQSHNSQVLETIDRGNIDNKKLFPLVKDLREQGIIIRSEMMIGLPGDTPEGYIENLAEDYRLGIGYMRAYPTIIIPNTPMYDPDYRIKHGLKFKKVLVPFDINIVNINEYSSNPFKMTECDFTDSDLYEEIELMYECDSYTNDELIEIYKYWWWYHNFYNLESLRDEIKRAYDSGFSIQDQIKTFFDYIDQGRMPVMKMILDFYLDTVRKVFSPEPVTKLTHVYHNSFLQIGMRTNEPLFFVTHKKQLKQELQQIYPRVNTRKWQNPHGFFLDYSILD
jgi:radical SAM superfamily enzyme YgiQ (UPF0313 family)